MLASHEGFNPLIGVFPTLLGEKQAQFQCFIESRATLLFKGSFIKIRSFLIKKYGSVCRSGLKK